MPPPGTQRPTHSPSSRQSQSAWWLAAFWLLLLVDAVAADSTPRILLLDAAASGNAIVAVGERGALLRTVDQARTWHAAA